MRCDRGCEDLSRCPQGAMIVHRQDESEHVLAWPSMNYPYEGVHVRNGLETSERKSDRDIPCLPPET